MLDVWRQLILGFDASRYVGGLVSVYLVILFCLTHLGLVNVTYVAAFQLYLVFQITGGLQLFTQA